MFLIILGLLGLSGLIATIAFPNLISNLTSRLPQYDFGKWFSNPKIKTYFHDYYFFKKNAKKILNTPLFIILGKENYKLYDLLAPIDSFGVKKTFETSEEAFEIITHHNANFLFIHSSLIDIELNKKYNPRLKRLIKRICKYRRQKYIDGLVIFPTPEIYKSTEAPPSANFMAEISFCTNIFEQFSKFFKILVPVYLIGHNASVTDERVFKNFFKHDTATGNNDLYLGFSCDFTKKNKNQKNYEFFKQSMTQFMTAFDLKTSALLGQATEADHPLDGIHALYRVKMENFYLSKNYLAYFLDRFDAPRAPELSNITILNSILFSSYEGSTSPDALRNILKYLALHGTDKIIFSERFLNSKSRRNIVMFVFTFLFIGTGLFLAIGAQGYLLEKRKLYIQKSIANYQKFAQSFNDLLANKFPFSSPQVRKSVTFDNFSYVLTQFQLITKDNQGYFYDHIVSLTNRADIQKFVDNMKNVNTFFNLQIDAASSTPIPFTVNAKFDFRVLPQQEYLANRIVNWALSSGGQTYGSKYGAQQHIEFSWTYGDPVTFRIEFPTSTSDVYNAQLVPQKPNYADAQIQGNYSMSVASNIVTYSYLQDNWALIRFIEEHESCRGANTACSPEVLQFIIPLANKSNVVFFCNLALQNSSGKVLTLPDFPTTAPLFNETSH